MTKARVTLVFSLVRGGRPLHQQAKAHIGLQIRSGALAGGARLPPLRQLAQELGVNRNTIQKVYAGLERAGLVVTRVGAGTFVAFGRHEPAVQTAESVRVSFQPVIAEALDQGITPNDLRQIFETQLADAMRTRERRSVQMLTSRRRFGGLMRHRGEVFD